MSVCGGRRSFGALYITYGQVSVGTFFDKDAFTSLLTPCAGITAGYHRLWSHRSYNAPIITQVVLACLGAGAVQGSIKWWSRGHRAHHRYTDTELDPYNAHKGFWYSHIGWMLVRPRRKPGVADVSDLSRNPVVRWQHKYYLPLILFMAFVLPTLVAHFGWGDAKGGLVYAGFLRLVFIHHVRDFGLQGPPRYLILCPQVDILCQLACTLVGRNTI